VNLGESTAFKLSWLGSVASQAIPHVKAQKERHIFLQGCAINPEDSY
jgi:hypothetical protein